MVIKFSEYKSINEKFGYPDSIIKLTEFLVNFMIEKLEWWTDRKGITNYSENFHFDTNDIDTDIISNKSFPVAHINLKYSIVRITKNNSYETSIGGLVYPFKSKNQVDPGLEYSNVYRGKINMKIEFKIYVVGKSIQIEKLREDCERLVRHELQHTYEGYNKLMLGIDPRQSSVISVFNNILVFNLYEKYPLSKTLMYTIHLFYSISHELEFNAFMAEFTSGKVKTIEEITGNNKFLTILKYDNFNDLYKDILKEYKKYQNINLDDLPKFVVNTTRHNIKLLKMKEPTWLSEYDKDFKGFLYQLWKRIQIKKDKFFKKSTKNFYMNR